MRLSIEIASGLAHIHGRRILYRDLQPRNVLFDEWGTIHLVDFDTAVSLDDRDMSDLSHRPVIDYMAPELMDGGCADERTDLYSLGATIYEMCDGRPPFAGTREEIAAARRTGPPASLERDDLLDTIAAFLNTDGGTQIVGVADDRTIVGIEVDYPHVKGSSDGWRLTFGALVSRDLGAEVMNCIDLQLEAWHGRTIAVIRCSQREEPTWIRDELFVRRTASTEKLSTRLAVAWWRQRWGSQRTERPAKPWT